MTYGLVAWYNPVRSITGSKRRAGSVGFTKELGRVQRLAASLVSGGFRTTATAALEYHANLPPMILALNHAVHNAATRLATLPTSHPLHAPWNSSKRTPQRHITTIHRLRDAFPYLRHLETIDPGLADVGWSSSADVHIAESKDEAIQFATSRPEEELTIFCDGSGYRGGVGAAAVAKVGNQYLSRSYHLGADDAHTVFEGEVVGIILATDIIREKIHVVKANILLDNQAAIQSMTRRRHQSGQQLIHEAQEAIEDIISERPHLSLSISWVPGHSNVQGNEEADKHAKRAAEGETTRRLGKYTSLDLGIAKSSAAIRARATKRRAWEWEQQWRDSPQGRRIIKFDLRPPGKSVMRSFKNLARHEISLLTQLRTAHVALSAYLHRIRKIDSPLCLRCLVPDTPAHYLLSCERYIAQRSTLRVRIGLARLNLGSLLATPRLIKHTIEFVKSTNRFIHYRLPSDLSPNITQ